MNQPLGHAVGNALEVKEAVGALKGEGPADLIDLCLTLGSALMTITGMCKEEKEAHDLLKKTIDSGSAFAKFKEFVGAQGGNVNLVEDISLLPKADYEVDVTIDLTGYVDSIKCSEIGMASLISGAGRETKNAPVDLGAGIIVYKKVGDQVKAGDVLAKIYSSDKVKLQAAADRVAAAYTIKGTPPEKLPLIYGIVK